MYAGVNILAVFPSVCSPDTARAADLHLHVHLMIALNDPRMDSGRCEPCSFSAISRFGNFCRVAQMSIMVGFLAVLLTSRTWKETRGSGKNHLTCRRDMRHVRSDGAT
jgi:hypothetical protein